MTQERPNRIDTEAIKQTIDLVEFVQRYTTLHTISGAGEYAGPCPRCGGRDRFHVKGQRFYCRQCYPRGGDVIDLVRLLHNLSFAEACRHLSADPAFSPERPTSTAQPPSSPAERAPQPPASFHEATRRILYAVQRRLYSDDGTAGRAYLQARGLEENTWRNYGLGYGQTMHPLRRRNEAAIFIPWLSPDGTRLEALRHRFTDPTLAKGERYALRPGSRLAIFGLHLLGSAPQLLIVEGEFNCMAMYQCGVMALSLGSETGARHQASLDLLATLSRSYARIDVWFDNQARAQDLLARLQQAAPFRKKAGQALSHAQDANELLMAGALEAFLHDHDVAVGR